jgi:hypothetical protein
MVRHGDDKEESWAQQQEKLHLEKIAAKKKAEERQWQKELHYMHCPKCGVKLCTLNLEGLEIDECPDCKGIWLDAGEFHQFAALNEEKKKSFTRQLFALFGLK